MLGAIANIFTGGTMGVIGDVAKEWIQTDKESAEAKSLFVKTLDPNGKMRRDLATFASRAYGFYLVGTTFLIFAVAFKIGDVEGAKLASKMMTDLFTTVTISWSAIVTASFGVNGINAHKGK